MNLGGRSGEAILVADADTAARSRLAAILTDAGFAVAETSSGAEAVRLLQTCVPLLAILEPYLPDVSGYEVCNQLRLRFGDDVPVIFVSGHRTEACDRVAGLLIGADDYLTQPVAPDELLARIRGLLRRAPRPVEAANDKASDGLTAREHQILTLLADGLSQKDIAGLLVISSKTVGTHVEHILAKLGVRTRAQAVAVAYREGLFSSESKDKRLRGNAELASYRA